MKLSSLFFLGMIFTQIPAHAVEVLKAQLDATKENIVVTVRHGGGCGTHAYELQMGTCFETMPVQCQAKIKHVSKDFCEAMITREAKFNLKKYGLQDSYFKDGSVTIAGDFNSQATVILPGTRVQPAAQKVLARCTTYTGSSLTIMSSKVSLKTASKTVENKIVKVDSIVYEVYPAIYSTTYKLDDGRSIATSFRSNSKTGTGIYLRPDGSRSPEFQCTSY